MYCFVRLESRGFFSGAHVVLMNHAPDALLLGECSKPALHVTLDEEVGGEVFFLVYHGLGADACQDQKLAEGVRAGSRGLVE